MLKHLNMPIVHCFAEQRNKHFCQSIDDEQLPLTILLSIGQQVMLTANLWLVGVRFLTLSVAQH